MSNSGNINSQDEIEKLKKEHHEFAYAISHDVGAPIRHVKEFTRLLLAERPPETETEEKYAGFIEQALERLGLMQEALLTYTRIDTDGGSIEKCDIKKVVADAMETLETLREEKGVKISVDVEAAEVPLHRKHVTKMLAYLIDNAIKFHDAGSSQRHVAITGRQIDHLYIIKISDNGIGMPEKGKEFVWRLFRTLNDPALYGGVGAGLSLARKIAGKYNIDLSLESIEGKGTDITLKMPLN